MWLRDTVKRRHHQGRAGREVAGLGRGSQSGSGDEADKAEVFAAVVNPREALDMSQRRDGTPMLRFPPRLG
jgi:hypothetical protein